MGIKCPKCQTDNPDSKRFCGNCGTSLDVDVSQTKTIETPPDELTRGYTFADRYEIIEELGRGGMGRVFRVEDIKAKEEIALKIIKSEISSDKKTIERFRNELNTTRKIRHKNVCGMYDFGETKGTHYITMEYVAGEDLKSLIRRVQQLAVGTAISIAKQICEGLAEAHRLGVIHRDLKPGNIMIDKSGNVRIMDFGIARSLKSKGITGAGVMIGTPEYMSPEQVEGKEADHRADIYSLGIILYEILVGRTPFEGDSAFSIGLKHKSEEPQDPRKYNSHIPEDLSLLILKCLEKDKENRYQSTGNMRSGLIKIEESIPTTEKVATKRKSITSREITVKFSPKKLIIPILTILVIVGIFFVAHFVRIIRKNYINKYLVLEHKQLTFSGSSYHPEISPDGNFIAYVNRQTSGMNKVIVQDLSSGQNLEVFSGIFCYRLRWLPNSAELSFTAQTSKEFKDRGVFIVPRLGGEARELGTSGLFSWSPDGLYFARCGSATKRISIINKSTGESRDISLEGSFNFIRDLKWSPHGKTLLFLTSDTDAIYSIWTIASDGTNQAKILETDVPISSPRWSPGGNAIYFLQKNNQANELWRISNVSNIRNKNENQSLIISGLQSGEDYSISSDGKKLFYTRELLYSNLALVKVDDLLGKKSENIIELTSGTLMHERPCISPDGRYIAFSKGDGVISNIYIMEANGESPKQVTFLNSLNTNPVWSPDGKEIAFGSNEGGILTVWKVSANGGRPNQFADTKLSDTYAISWFPGSEILYQRPGNRNFHFLNPITGEEIPLIKDDSIGWIFEPRYSPDGKRIVVAWNRPPTSGLWIINVEDSTHVRVSDRWVFPYGWSSDGKWIYAFDGIPGDISIIKIESKNGQSESLLTLPYLIDSGPPEARMSMTVDNKLLFFSNYKNLSDVWIIENFDVDIKKTSH